MNAYKLHQQLAWEIGQENPSSSQEENWRRAGEQLIRNRAAWLAEQFPFSSPEENWLSAERSIQWEEWAARNLRPFIAPLKPDDCVHGAWRIGEIEKSLQLNDVGWRAVVVLDGAVEFSQKKFQLHSGNCVDPCAVVESKDKPFYEIGAAVTELYDGVVVEIGRRTSPSTRAFQDGLAACFPSAMSGFAVVGWALHLKRRLGLYNERKRLNWTDEVHARISIGLDWEAAIVGLADLHRGEIALDWHLTEKFDAAAIAMLKPVGLRARKQRCKSEQDETDRTTGGGTHDGGRFLARA